MYHIALIAAVATASWVLVYLVSYWAQRRQVLDIPNNRSLHSCPTPTGGGVVIAGICTTGWIVTWLLQPAYSWPIAVAFAIGAASIAAISWADDLRPLSKVARFMVHCLAAILVMVGGAVWNHVAIPLIGEVELGWIGIPLTFLWIVSLANVFNFMDGIDGIAALQAVVAGIGWFLLGGTSGESMVSMLGLLIASSSLGFLIHNWSPARIFMGDVGSVFLGYSFAFLAVNASRDNPRLALAGVLLVWPFVFDAIFTIFRRFVGGQNILAAHRSHLYQRLVIAGWSHRKVASLYGLLALTGVFLAASSVGGDRLVVVAVSAMSMSLWIIVRQQESRCAAKSAGNH